MDDLDALIGELNASASTDAPLLEGSSGVEDWLAEVIRRKGSDLLLVAGRAPMVRIDGPLSPIAGRRTVATARPRGLVLIGGATGSGNTTTLAALVDEINRREARHIITVEDPMTRKAGSITREESLARLVTSGAISRAEAMARSGHLDELEGLLR